MKIGRKIKQEKVEREIRREKVAKIREEREVDISKERVTVKSVLFDTQISDSKSQ
jgi:hypothetical protein